MPRSARLRGLLDIVRVGVISGGDWPQFKTQVVAMLPDDANLEHLSLLPACGTKFYEFGSGWAKLYSEDFTADEKEIIVRSLQTATELWNVSDQRAWGDRIEDRGSQITFSALGQQAPLVEKKKWDPDFAKRKRMKAMLDELIPTFSVRIGGTTSVDVTKRGIDKAYGIRKLRDIIGVLTEDMIFIGDALFPGGNDYPVKETGVYCIQVRDPHETKRVIESIIACLGSVDTRHLARNSDE